MIYTECCIPVFLNKAKKKLFPSISSLLSFNTAFTKSSDSNMIQSKYTRKYPQIKPGIVHFNLIMVVLCPVLRETNDAIVYQWDMERTHTGNQVVVLWILSNRPRTDVEGTAEYEEL